MTSVKYLTLNLFLLLQVLLVEAGGSSNWIQSVPGLVLASQVSKRECHFRNGSEKEREIEKGKEIQGEKERHGEKEKEIEKGKEI